jgi:Zn-dependent protease with chaperone function
MMAAGNSATSGFQQVRSKEPTCVTEYALPSDKLQKAHALYVSRGIYPIVQAFYLFGVLLVFLWRRWLVGCRDWVESYFESQFVRGLVFVPTACFAIWVLLLPPSFYNQYLLAKSGLSTADPFAFALGWMVEFLLAAPIPIILLWILFAVIRHSPRRWWLYAWLLFAPIIALEVYASPLVIEPLISWSRPLGTEHTQLVEELQRVAQRAGYDIPSSRMFEMIDLDRHGGPNGYVTGLGTTQRIVIFDTTFSRLNTSQILFVCAHEMGHYALKHRVKLLLFSVALYFPIFYLGFRLTTWLQRRWGHRWDIRSLDDWASMPLLSLVFSVMLFLSNPVVNTYRRYLEHQADQYALEITHGVVPESNQIAAKALQISGEDSLEYPMPNRFIVLWAWDHPPIGDRVCFAQTYVPWNKGQPLKFVKAPGERSPRE